MTPPSRSAVIRRTCPAAPCRSGTAKSIRQWTGVRGPWRDLHVLPTSSGYLERGVASWYGEQFHGKPTSSREPYDMYAMTAAHKTLPLPTYVRVRNLRMTQVVIVRVNDRGPFVHNRVIDLSYAAALKLGMIADGTGLVEISAINFDGPGGDEPTRVTQRPARSPRALQACRSFVQVGAFGNRENADRRKALRRQRLDNVLSIRCGRRHRHSTGCVSVPYTKSCNTTSSSPGWGVSASRIPISSRNEGRCGAPPGAAELVTIRPLAIHRGNLHASSVPEVSDFDRVVCAWAGCSSARSADRATTSSARRATC